MDAVYETIAKAIEAKLQTLSEIRHVQRYKQSGMQTVQMPAILLRDGPEVVEQDKRVGNGDYVLEQCSRTYGILLFARQDEQADSRSGDELINGLTQVVQTAMMADPTWGGVAITTDEVGSQPIDPREGVPELNRYLEYQVTYQRRRTDPTQAS